MNKLLEQLKSAEVDLQRPEIRRDARTAGAYLHESFIEFGRSGQIYDRTRMLEMLQTEEPRGRIVSQDYAVARLDENAALLTYRTAVVEGPGSLHRHTLRASLWIKTPNGWKLRFHQGTPTDAFPIDEG